MSLIFLIYLMGQLATITSVVNILLIFLGIAFVVLVLIAFGSALVNSKVDPECQSALSNSLYHMSIRLITSKLRISLVVFLLLVKLLLPTGTTVALMTGTYIAKESGIPQSIAKAVNTKIQHYLGE